MVKHEEIAGITFRKVEKTIIDFLVMCQIFDP